ncbi:hypothetical protein B0T16DRAFT_455922 [Cercophora newfieldiana]|uniref:Uncharacterized protein n=1 Tax=Cercophora newfieldiana TaxID=92897 RepID=A0AA39Y9Y4_9PEZI|nr:hypothetical protein B0T16DRAFT_455922 [Cercophora newfieldiana]
MDSRGTKRPASFEKEPTGSPKRQCPDDMIEFKFFACPFFVRNPLVFFECRPRHRKPAERAKDKPTNAPNTDKDQERRENTNMFQRDRLSDLVQHIKLKHKAGSLFCPRCRVQFEGDNQQSKFEKHCRDDGSECAKDTSMDKVEISDAEMQQIKETGGKGVSPDQRWKQIWHILFGGKADPRLRLASAPRAIPGTGLRDIKDWIRSFAEPPLGAKDCPICCFPGCRHAAVDEMCQDIIASVKRSVPNVPTSAPHQATSGLDPTSGDMAPQSIGPDPGPAPEHGDLQPLQSYGDAGLSRNEDREDGSFSSLVNYNADTQPEGNDSGNLDPRLFSPESQLPQSPRGEN